MTGHENQDPMVSPDALATRSTAAEWLIARRMSESWMEDDQADLDRWLAQSTANRVAYWRLDGAWGEAQRLAGLRQPMRPPVGRSTIFPNSRILGIATALAVIAILCIVGTNYIRQSDIRDYATPVGGHLTIALADGSKIELNTDSVLRFSNRTGQRQATLEKGEAYSQIEHDPSRSFTLFVGGQRVIDLGTKFSVRKQTGKVEVRLIEGRAKIEPEDSRTLSRAVVLAPGDVAVATPQSITVSKRPISQLSDSLGWRRGVLAFGSATLAEAADEFNRYNNTKIVIADKRAARLTIHGTFPANDVSGFADAAQAYFKLHVENRSGAIVISR